MRPVKRFRARAAGLLLLFAALACSAPEAPPSGVTDTAGLLTPEQRIAISVQHEQLLRDHDVDYRVDVANDAGDLLVYGVRRFRELEVGSRSQSQRGLLLVLDPSQGRVRVEVGQNLEGVFSDAFVAYLETRQLLARWVMTPAQMDSVARSYRGCRAGPARVDGSGAHAVVRYGIYARECAPWFLVHEEGAWRLDLASAQQAVRFGADNAWHFAPDVDHAYTFAFQDWRLDPNGYPHLP